MSTTTPSRDVTTTTCSSFIVTGAFEVLHELGKLVASNVNPGHLHVTMTEYPVGWRLQITSDDNYYPEHAVALVEQRIKRGVPVEIANGRNALRTFLYTVKNEPMMPIESSEVEEYPF